MTRIPPKLRKRLAADPYYRECARRGLHEHLCGGRITWEHALIFAGKQVQERFAIVPLCAKAHAVDAYQDGGDFEKDINLWIALNRANDDELCAISRALDYFVKRAALNKKYGAYVVPVHDAVSSPIQYPWPIHRYSIV